MSILLTEFYQPSECGCACEGESLLGGGSTSLKDIMPQNPDADNDGDIDKKDLAALHAIVEHWKIDNGISSEEEQASAEPPAIPSEAELLEMTKLD